MSAPMMVPVPMKSRSMMEMASGSHAIVSVMKYRKKVATQQHTRRMVQTIAIARRFQPVSVGGVCFMERMALFYQ